VTADGPAPIALAWSVPAASVDRNGRSFAFEGDTKDCRALAEALGVVSVDVVKIEGRLTRASKDAVRLKADLEAAVTQQSVVSLEPVGQTIACAVDRVFDETAGGAAEPSPDVDLGEDDPPDPLENGMVPVGALVQELLALELDPYPKGDTEEWRDHIEDVEETEEESPFAVLKQLKS